MKEKDIILQIRQRRKTLKYSQAFLAEKLHLSVKAYQNIEQGYTRIDLGRLMDIAHILDIDVHHLLFPNHHTEKASMVNMDAERSRYLKMLEQKESYITLLEERISHYRSVIEEFNSKYS